MSVENKNKETKEQSIEDLLREAAWAAWLSAANAYRMYPDNKHTFTDYWNNLGKSETEKLLAGYSSKVQEGNAELLEALNEAIQIIRSWHGMGMPKEMEQKMWAIYESQSPEMKRIKKALTANESSPIPS